MMNFAKSGGRGLALASMLVAAAAFCSPSTAYAQHHHGHHLHGGSIGPGAAVGLGLGALALGTGAYYPYGYYAPVPAYYAPPAYPYPRSCWYPQYGGYFACWADALSASPARCTERASARPTIAIGCRRGTVKLAACHGGRGRVAERDDNACLSQLRRPPVSGRDHQLRGLVKTYRLPWIRSHGRR